MLRKVKVCPGAQKTRLVECDCFELLDYSSEMSMEGSWGRKVSGIRFACLLGVASVAPFAHPIGSTAPFVPVSVLSRNRLQISLFDACFNFSIHCFRLRRCSIVLTSKGRSIQILASAVSFPLTFGRSLFFLAFQDTDQGSCFP